MNRIGMVLKGIGFYRFPEGVVAHSLMMAALEGLPMLKGEEGSAGVTTIDGLLVARAQGNCMWVTDFVPMGTSQTSQGKSQVEGIIDSMTRQSDVTNFGGAMYRSIGNTYLQKGTLDAFKDSGVLRCYLKEEAGLLPRHGTASTHPQYALDLVCRGKWQDVTALEDAENYDEAFVG